MLNLKRILFFTLFIYTINIIMAATPVSINGKLKVVGLQLSNECGNPVQLRGVSSHGIQWFGNCLPDSALDFAASSTGMGADIFRIAMYVDEGGYLTNPTSFTNQVNTLVDKATARGMYVIIDWHVLNPGDPNAHIAEARTFWQAMANAHKGKKNVLYEICNEPNGVPWSTVKTYADDIIPKIRAIDPDTVIIVGTPNWSQLGADVVNNKLNYTNIMYTFHFYSASHQTSMLTNYVGSLPIFATEWAASEASGTGTLNTARATEFINIMGGNNSAGVKISWCTWSYSDKAETSALFNTNTCSSGAYDTAHLSTWGNYTRNNILTPGKTFIACGAATNTPVVNSPTRTRTATPSITRTRTITVFSPTVTRTFTTTSTRTSTNSVTPYAGTPTQTSTLSPVPTPGLVNAVCVQGMTFNLTDGNLNDSIWQGGVWTAVTRTVEGTQGAVTAEYKIRWDSAGLKVGVNVVDPVLCGAVANWYQDDAVEIYIDSANNHSATYDANDYQFSVRYNDAILREQNNRLGTVTAVTYRTANGYSAEFNIPWTSIGVTGGSGTNIGFDVGVDHNETCGATRNGVLMWNGTVNNYQNTSAFGDALMLACAATPSSTATGTRTATRVNTSTRTATVTSTVIPTNTSTATPVNTSTATPVNTSTATPVNTSTATPVNTSTRTATLINTAVNSATSTRTVTLTGTRTPLNTVTVTATNTPVNTNTFTSTATRTNTVYQSPTVTPSVTQTPTGTPPSPTNTPVDTLSFTATRTFTVTRTSTLQPTNTFTAINTAINTPVNTNTPVSTVTGTSTPVNTNTAVSTVTGTRTPVNTNTPASTATQTRTPVNTVVNTVQPSATYTHTSVNTVLATATMTVVLTATPVKTPCTGLVYPNPYNPAYNDLKIDFRLESPTNDVRLLVYTMSYRKVLDLKINHGPLLAGDETAKIEAANFLKLSNGAYYYAVKYLTAGGEIKSRISVLYIMK